MNQRQTLIVGIFAVLFFVMLLLFIDVRGLDAKWDDPCADQPITECEVQ